MSALAQMTATILAPSRRREQAENAREQAQTRAGAMRRALESGPLKAADLARVAGISSALVMPLLRHDLAKGRVFTRRTPNGGTLYELNADYDEQLASKLADAMALLKRHGYSVRRSGA